MESNYKERIALEMQDLKEIVNNVFMLDLDAKNRKRGVIDARKIYSKILRDRGYGYELIGRSIEKDHTTVIHYMRSIDFTLKYDRELRDNYITCKNLFLENRELPIVENRYKDKDLFMTVVRLNAEVQRLVVERKNLLNNFVEYVEQYEIKNGYPPSLYEYKHTILPLFNE
jgi:hypothetical protein